MDGESQKLFFGNDGDARWFHKTFAGRSKGTD